MGIRTHYLVLCLLLQVPSGCTGSGSGPTEPEVKPEELVLSTSGSLNISNGFVRAYLGSTSQVSQGRFKPDSGSASRWTLALNFAGILLATRSSSSEGAMSGSLLIQQLSGLELLEDGGLFLVEGGLDGKNAVNWPTELGAPSYPDGTIRPFGDVMAWGAFQASGSQDGVLENIRIGAALFAYLDGPAGNALFQRIDIHNTGGQHVHEIYFGMYSDPDVFPLAEGGCDSNLIHSANRSAFDQDRGLLMTYTSRDAADDPMPDRCYGSALGMGYLDLPPSVAGPFANRIVAEYATTDYYPSFGEPLIRTPTAAINALLGLDAHGNPMINPVTGQETRFAFTGDPITGQGWLDERNDVRQLLSQPVFSLGPGETRSFTIVWIMVGESSTEEAIGALRVSFDRIQQETDLWHFED